MKSTSVSRGTTKKNGRATAADNANEDIVGNDFSADSNSDENYDDIMIEHFETTFEKSLAPPKRARILGGGRKPRGTFGSGMKQKASLFSTHTNNKTTTTILLRPLVGEKPATVALRQQQQQQEQQRSQENLAFNNLNSIGMGTAIESNDDDETNLFEMLHSIPSDLRPPTSLSHQKKPAAAPHHFHQRSESSIASFPSLSPFRLVRSSTHVPQRPKFLNRLQRSHSVALNQNVDDDSISNVWDENNKVNPYPTTAGELDAIERSTMLRGPPKPRKFIRAPQRRHSWISGMTRSASTTTASSGSMSSSNNILHGSMGSFPDAIDELDIPSVQRSQMISSLSQVNVNNMSPEPRSETSTSTTGCRKRGVSSSSVSDFEEYIQLSGGSMSSKRRNHSTEQLLRIYSPPPGQIMPLAPSLTYNDDFDNSSDFVTSFGRHQNDARRFSPFL